MIPIGSRISRVIREAVWCHDSRVPWDQARDRILRSFGHANPCHAPQNHGFTILGWLYGADFGDKLCKAVNCGYDTDCTGATLGSVLGILGGAAGIPARWREPVGEAIVLHKFTGDCDAPADIAQLTLRTEAIAARMLPERSDAAEFAPVTAPPEDLSVLFRNERALRALARDPMSAIERVDGVDIAFHYNGEPVLRPGIAKTIAISATVDDVPLALRDVVLAAPGHWSVEPLGSGQGRFRFTLKSDEVADSSEVTVFAASPDQRITATFVMLGPGEARGYPANQNVPTCPNCRARKEACVCPKG